MTVKKKKRMRRVYSDEEKAVVCAALLQGQSVNQTAKDYKIPVSTVSRWKKIAYGTDGIQKPEIAELLLGYLEDNLRTLRKQAVVFGDHEWLKDQGAQELAVLHGVMTDKSIRLLEALSNINVTQD